MLALALLQISLSRYPILDPGVQAHYLSSHDRAGGNDDGFDGTYSALYVDANGEQVIFDVKGPGTLYTLWFTSRVNGWSPLGTGRIRFEDLEVQRVPGDLVQLNCRQVVLGCQVVQRDQEGLVQLNRHQVVLGHRLVLLVRHHHPFQVDQYPLSHQGGQWGYYLTNRHRQLLQNPGLPRPK